MITLDDAKNLQLGEILIHVTTGKRWKVNGQPKTWVRSPERVRIPVKHGLFTYDYVTEELLSVMVKGE